MWTTILSIIFASTLGIVVKELVTAGCGWLASTFIAMAARALPVEVRNERRAEWQAEYTALASRRMEISGVLRIAAHGIRALAFLCGLYLGASKIRLQYRARHRAVYGRDRILRDNAGPLIWTGAILVEVFPLAFFFRWSLPKLAGPQYSGVSIVLIVLLDSLISVLVIVGTGAMVAMLTMNERSPRRAAAELYARLTLPEFQRKNVVRQYLFARAVRRRQRILARERSNIFD